MSNLTSILGADLISVSPSIINGNFQNLNISMIATSIISSSTLTGRILTSSVAASIISLTTVANDVVRVWAKGTITGSTSSGSVALIYNGVTKDAATIKQAAAADEISFALMYAETPGAATANVVVSVVATGALVINNPKILVERIT